MEPDLPETPPSTAGAPADLTRLADLGGLGLAAVCTLYSVLAIGAGLAFQELQFPGDELHRVGLVAASAIDLRIGVALILAAALAALGARTTRTVGAGPVEATSTRAASILVAVAAALSVVLAALAVRAQYHQLDLRNTDPTTAFHLSQGTYVVGSIGPALLAAAVALGVARRP